MSPYYGIPEELRKTLGDSETSCNADGWQRWDEDLVGEFGRWLSRIAKAFAVVFLAGSALVAAAWLRNIF